MEILYCDIDFSFKKDQYGNIKNVYNADSVKQSVFTILATRRGERVMRPEFGSNLHFLLFEPIDEQTTNDIRYEVYNAITKNEDRININEVLVSPNTDNNYYIVSLDYVVIGTGSTENLTIALNR